MKGTKTIAIAAAALLFTGCFHEFHEKQPGAGRIIPEFEWQFDEDADTPIHHLLLVVDGPDGYYSKVYNTPAEFAAAPLNLQAGDYKLLFAANMSEADGYLLDGVPPTRGLADNPISARRQASTIHPDQTWFAITPVTVVEGAGTRIRPEFQRLMAHLQVNVTNVPAGATVTATVANAARSVDLMGQSDFWRAGRPSDDTEDDVIANGQAAYLMPSASGQEGGRVVLSVTDANGKTSPFDCNTPLMESGKSYQLNVDFSDLDTDIELTLTSTPINDWEDAWTIQGKIFSPQ